MDLTSKGFAIEKASEKTCKQMMALQSDTWRWVSADGEKCCALVAHRCLTVQTASR